jgi:hypothetical protein
MKKIIITRLAVEVIKMLVVIAICGSFSFVTAQHNQSVSGRVIETGSDEAVMFATVALYDSTGSALVSGGVTNMEGEFVIGFENTGSTMVRISAIGFETWETLISSPGGTNLSLGEIRLNHSNTTIEGVSVIGERIRARTETDRTIFFVNRKMQDASSTGVDILKLIPGIQMDFRQNISLEGSRNIMILVDGKERDRNFISQLNASHIDRVEVIGNPPAKYDASVTGIINIILSKNRETGMDGLVYAELPTSGSEMYLFPAYSLHYGINKINLFTSYNGELSYFDIHESGKRAIYSPEPEETGTSDQIISNQYIRQNTWSHRFHYGFDYIVNEKNKLNFYAFYNPYSNEHSGISGIQSGNGLNQWTAEKKDNDRNHGAFYSLFYKHLFNETSGHEIDFDVSYYNLRAANSTIYFDEETGYNQVNMTEPKQDWRVIRVDYSLPFGEKLKFSSGIRTKHQAMEDANSRDFRYSDRTLAAYGSLMYGSGKFDFQSGIRAKNYSSGLTGSYSIQKTALLPGAVVNYRYSPSKSIRFSWRSAVSFPAFHQLNNYRSFIDPFSSHSGNHNLRPVHRKNFILEHSLRFQNNYISSGLFYNISSDVINNLTTIKDNIFFESTTNNLGDIYQYGLQISGALNISKSVIFNPYVRFYEVNSVPNGLARQHNISKKQKFGWASGFSAMAAFNHDITATVMFQYASPLLEIQGSTFHDALYFLSLEKTFRHGIKAGLNSAIPLARSFVYQGSEIESDDFYSYSTGNIKMSALPLFLKITYQFSTGSKRERITRAKEEIDALPGKGF